MKRVVLVSGCVALIVSALFPPWRYQQTRYGRDEFLKPRTSETRGFAGYHWITNEPQAVEKYDSPGRAPSLVISYEIDRSRLVLEWLLIVLVSAGLILWSTKEPN